MCHLGRKVVAGALVFFDPKSYYRSWLSFWLSSFHASQKVHAGPVLFYTTGFQTMNMLSQRKVNSITHCGNSMGLETGRDDAPSENLRKIMRDRLDWS